MKKKKKIEKLRKYDYLKKDFENVVKELQSKCKHPKKGVYWADEWWAFGHGTGRKLKICSFCNKIIETKPKKPQWVCGIKRKKYRKLINKLKQNLKEERK